MDKVKQTLKDSASMRWGVLLLISGLMFATYWFQDMFSGIKQLFESQLGFSSEDFGIVISATTWANCLGMIILGGIILDRWGIRMAGILCGTMATLGGVLTALGASDTLTTDPDSKLTIMIVGRIMFGVGLEIICVVVSRTVVKWFKGRNLALAMAINVGFGRMGSALATALSIDIGAGLVSPAVNFGATLVGIGLIMFLVYLIFDVRLDRQMKTDEEKVDDEKFQLSDLLKLVRNRSFVWITLLCMTFYSAVFPFYQYTADLLVHKFGFTYTLPDLSQHGFWDTLGAFMRNGPKVASFIPLGTILFTPIFGSIVDRRGKAASLMILGSAMLIFAHLSLTLFDSAYMGYAGLLSLGIAFSLIPAAMWPSVAKIVPESRLGTAYATMFTVQNWGLALFFWLIGSVLDLANAENLEAIRAKQAVYDYTIPTLMLSFLGAIAIVMAFLLKASDRRQGFGLELPEKKVSSPPE
jgi:MFS family permease